MKKLISIKCLAWTCPIVWYNEQSHAYTPPENSHLKACVETLVLAIPFATKCHIAFKPDTHHTMECRVTWEHNGDVMTQMVIHLGIAEKKPVLAEVKEIKVEPNYRKTKLGYSLFDCVIEKWVQLLQTYPKGGTILFVADRLSECEPRWGSVAWAKHGRFADCTETDQIKVFHEEAVQQSLFPILMQSIQSVCKEPSWLEIATYATFKETISEVHPVRKWFQAVLNMAQTWQTPLDIRQAKLRGYDGQELKIEYLYGKTYPAEQALPYGVWLLLQRNWDGKIKVSPRQDFA